MTRTLVVFCPPQVTPPHFSDKGDFKPSLIPTPAVSLKTRPYSLHIPGLRQSWLHTVHDTLSQGSVLVTPISSSLQKPARWLRHYLEMLYLIYLISRWQKATVAQPGLENSASGSPCSPSSLQDCAGAAPCLFLFSSSILSGFCFCFTAVQHGIASAMTSLSQTSLLPHWFSVLPWSQGHLPASAPRRREKQRVGGEREKVFTSVFLVWTDRISWDTCQEFSPQRRVTVPLHCQYHHVGLSNHISIFSKQETLFK